MIKVLSFLSNENCFTGHSRGPCGPRFEHHWHTRTQLCNMPAIIVLPSVQMPALVRFTIIKSSPFDFQGIEIIPRLHTSVPITKMFIKF